MLLYFLESGDSCALSMGTYIGCLEKQRFRAVSERDTSLVMIPVRCWPTMDEDLHLLVSVCAGSYQTRLEEMMEAIDALAFMDLQTRLRQVLVGQVKIQGQHDVANHASRNCKRHTSRVVVQVAQKPGKGRCCPLHRNAVEMKDF